VKWTEAERQKLRNLRNGGMTGPQMAARFGVSEAAIRNAISYHCTERRGGRNWSEADREKIKALWCEDGLSASLIGARMGASRNAIIGVVHRMGLSGARHGTTIKRSTKNRPRKIRVTSRGNAYGVRLPMEAMPLPQADDLARVSFADLEDNHCRFIVGDPSHLRGQPMFCGLPRHVGLSYCTGHAARCIPGLFIEPQTRAETPVERETELV
jgi:hypothetical protein